MEDMDYYEWEASKKRFSPSKIIKFIFRAIVLTIIFGTFAVILGRIQLMKIPKALTGVTSTEEILQTLEDNTFDAVYQQTAKSFDEKGWYHISDVILSDAAGQVQLTVRYNSRSTINTLMEKYSLTDRPSGEVFVYILSDDRGNVYTDYVFAAKSRPLYEFRRVIFSGVDLSDVGTLTLDVYYGEDVSSEGRMNASFAFYSKEYEVDELTADDVRRSTLTFTGAPAYVSYLD